MLSFSIIPFWLISCSFCLSVVWVAKEVLRFRTSFVTCVLSWISFFVCMSNGFDLGGEKKVIMIMLSMMECYIYRFPSISCRKCSTHTSFAPRSWCMCWNYCNVSNLPDGHGTRASNCAGMLWTFLLENWFKEILPWCMRPFLYIYFDVLNVLAFYFFRRKTLLGIIGEYFMLFQLSFGKRDLGLCTKAGYLLSLEL